MTCVSRISALPTLADFPADRQVWLLSAPVQARSVAAAALNAPILQSEVCIGLGRVPHKKSAGPDRVPGEAWRCARAPHFMDPRRPGSFVFAPALHSVFAHVFATEDFPEQFTESTWTPIFKKGDALQCTNYRGIAVGGVLGKLYTSLLTRRLSTWAAAQGNVRHPGQAGFMRGLGTQHHQFVMRHLVTRHSVGTGALGVKPLYVCQVDFAKAFDKVPRELLWERLRERGVHGVLLSALKHCYDTVLLRAKVNGKLGDPFPSSQGVKQGDPPSPDLFGLYIEILSDFIDAADRHRLRVRSPTSGLLLEPCDNDAPTLDCGLRVSSILFADDANLLALSAGRMNYLLALLALFCDAFGMSVNVPSSSSSSSTPRAPHASATRPCR